LARVQRRKEKDDERAKEIAKCNVEEEKRRKITEDLRATGPRVQQFRLVEAPDITMGVIMSHADSRLENSHAGFIKRMDRVEEDEPERIGSVHSRFPSSRILQSERSDMEKQNIKVEDFRKINPKPRTMD